MFLYNYRTTFKEDFISNYILNNDYISTSIMITAHEMTLSYQLRQNNKLIKETNPKTDTNIL